MRLGVLIPDRNDRPEFLANCMRMLKMQTLQPDIVELFNDKPLDDECDISRRYRMGYDRLRDRGLDLIAFIENDDWYHPQYLQTHVEKWLEAGMPDMLGSNFTIYFHLKLRRYFTMYHEQRSSAMNTFIRPNMTIAWPVDKEPYTDMWLWEKYGNGWNENEKPKGYIWKPPLLSIGMKHGIGKLGGFSHVDYLERFDLDDNGFLESTIRPVDEQGWHFYESLSKRLTQ